MIHTAPFIYISDKDILFPIRFKTDQVFYILCVNQLSSPKILFFYFCKNRISEVKTNDFIVGAVSKCAFYLLRYL